MIRFVDLRVAEIEGACFAWWDTVRNCFESHKCSMAWETWEDFAVDYVAQGVRYDLPRYKRLAPDWCKNEVKR